jgi:hypothetical protein
MEGIGGHDDSGIKEKEYGRYYRENKRERGRIGWIGSVE